MHTLTRDEMVALVDRPVQTVEIPEWQATVLIRALSAREADRVREFAGGDNTLARYTALLLCDQDGNRLLTDEDADWLGERNQNALWRICEAGGVLNALGGSEEEALAKN